MTEFEEKQTFKQNIWMSELCVMIVSWYSFVTLMHCTCISVEDNFFLFLEKSWY